MKHINPVPYMVLFLLLLATTLLAVDESRVLLFSNEHLQLWGWRSMYGGMTWSNTCAKSVGPSAIGNVTVRLEFLDFFGSVLPGSTTVTLGWVERERALCHSQAVPSSAREFFKIRAYIIHYDHH